MFALAALYAQDAPGDPGEAKYAAGQYAEARDILERQIAAGNATAKTHFWLGYTYLALRNRERAVRGFEAYLKENPRDEDVLYALAHTYAELSNMSLQQIFVLDPSSARSYQMRGIRDEIQQAWQEAIQDYERALKLVPGMHGVHASIARIYQKELKDPAAAARDYEAELAIDPFSRDANAFLAEYYAARLPAKARKHKNLVDACFSEDRAAAAKAACPIPKPSGEAEQGIFWQERGQPRKSLPHLLAWRAAEPRNLDAYYYLGEAFTDLKVEAIRRLRGANPRSYRLHQILAESYESAYETTWAIEEYREVLRLQPNAPGVRYELGRLLSENQTEEPIKLFEEELALDPNHYLAAGRLGRIYVALQQPDKAIPLLERALQGDPALVAEQKALGQAWAAKREFSRALPYYEGAARANPGDPQIHFLLAQTYQALGRKEDAARERALVQRLRNQTKAPAEAAPTAQP